MEIYCQISTMDDRVYERLVGIRKRVLKKTLGNQYLTEKQLTAILIEAEAVMNSCPLVYVQR